jgi:hypothetical protein
MYQIPGERWVEALQLFRGTWCKHRRDAISTLDFAMVISCFFFSMGFNHWNCFFLLGHGNIEMAGIKWW